MRLHALLVTLAVIVAVVSCGKSEPSPAPPPTTGGGGGGSGGGDNPGGGGTSGDDGGGTAGGGTTGGTQPGKTTSHDGTLTVERVDADAACDALVPTSAPDAVKLTATDGTSCGAGVSDGTGNVAAQVGTGTGSTIWQVFAPDGHALHKFEIQSQLVVEPEGWQGAKAFSNTFPILGVEHLTIAADGSVRQRLDFPVTVGNFGQWGLFPDPLGGSALAYNYTWFDPTTKAYVCLGNATRLDASGRTRGSQTVLRFCRNGGVGVSSAGQNEMLVIELGSNYAYPTAMTHWYLPGAVEGMTPGTDPTSSFFFDTDLVPLIDGSLVLREGDKWTRHYAHLADQSDAAPGWLVSRPGFRFRNTRGAKGYALLPPAGTASADCSQRVELVAQSGRLCANVTIKGDGGSCSTAAVDQGWDGTLVQQGARDRCSWRIWPKLLAAP
ncbi:MAG TPA: hypothetical protein VF875_16145 [Anaeromyxobacter sp.]